MNKAKVMVWTVAALAMCGITWAVHARIEPAAQFTGSVQDASLRDAGAAAITDSEKLKRLWKAWKIAGKMPEINFAKQLVVTSTWSGSKMTVTYFLDDDENLVVSAGGTKDLRPGFRYVVAIVNRKGIRAVNDVALHHAGKKEPNKTDAGDAN